MLEYPQKAPILALKFSTWLGRAIEKGGQSPPAQLEPKSKFSKRDLYYFRVNASFNVSIYEGRSQSSSWKKHENLFHPRKGILVLFTHCTPSPLGGTSPILRENEHKNTFSLAAERGTCPQCPSPRVTGQ